MRDTQRIHNRIQGKQKDREKLFRRRAQSLGLGLKKEIKREGKQAWILT